MKTKTMFGIADAHGIESFIEKTKANWKKHSSVLYLRTMTNRQRHAVLYVVEITEASEIIIKDLIEQKKYMEALVYLKGNCLEFGFPKREKEQFLNSWLMIPNPRLDPWR